MAVLTTSAMVLGVGALLGGANAGGKGSIEATGSGLIDGLGLVELAPDGARGDFAQGVRALHNFWWEEAEDRFAAVVEGAPDFALGYWGQAMALHRNPFGHQRPPVDSMRVLLDPLGGSPDERASRAGTPHEGAYLGALEILLQEGEAAQAHPAYVHAMESLAAAYPHDVEARAFHARALLLLEPVWGRAESTWPKVVAAAEGVLDEVPDHPGALHYLIHALDRPETASRGLEAARRYSTVRTGASHAVHMPSHIYMQLGRWDQVIAGNRSALQVSRDFAEATGRDARALDAHAVDFLVYALLQTGRWSEAEGLILEFRGYRQALDTGALRWYDGLWSAVFAAHTGYGPGGELPRSGYASLDEALTQVILAVHAGEESSWETADSALQALAAERDAPAWRLGAAQSNALVLAASGQGAEAVDVLREALAIQAEMVRPNETPTPLVPPEEQLAATLLQLGRFDEAARALDALDARWPGRIGAAQLRARIAAGRRGRGGGEAGL